MKNHLDQYRHNIEFHECLCSEFPDKYFDWKTTVIFYCALHLLNALSESRGIRMETTHTNVDKQINPNIIYRKRRYQKLVIPDDIYDDYKVLLKYSKKARYNGFKNNPKIDYDLLIKKNYYEAVEHFLSFSEYMASQSIK